MSTITVWLLVSIGWVTHGHREGRPHSPHNTVAKFATAEECQRVREVLYPPDRERNYYRTPLMCVEATILKEGK